MTRLILSLAFSALLTAPALADDAVIPSVRSFASRTPPTPNLNGRWARLQVTTAVSKVPVLGDTTSETVGVVLLDIRQTDDRLKIRERVCGLRGESLGGIVKTRFPKGFLRALSGQRKSGVLKQTGERWTYEELEHTCVRGVSLDGPDEEPLPTDPTDPRIRDADKDGQPGLTVKIDGFVAGDVYVIQRDSAAVFGTLLPNGQIRGHIDWKADQEVLGASSSILGGNPETTPHPDPEKSYFQMRRVPRRATCRDVLARFSTLFELKED